MGTCNDRKICFILCVNNEQFVRECLFYLDLLQVPEGYETEVLTIEGAVSMTAGYNEGMRASDARYKVYLHQDTFITEPLFIQKLLEVFRQDERIGMVGMIGAEQLSRDGVMWHERRCGDFYRLEDLIRSGSTGVEQLQEGIRDVEVVDGFLIATQYDIPWREDLLKGWDFYDVSQCMEFRRAGYRIVVPAQKPSWTIHACGAPGFWHYEENRRIVMEEYPEIRRGEGLRILFLNSGSVTLFGLPFSLTSLGHTVNVPDWKVDITQYTEKDRQRVEETLEEGYYDLAVTYNFSPGVAKACENQQVKYYSYVFDSPCVNLYTDAARGAWHYTSVFDRRQYERMKDFGLKNLYYMPLGADVQWFGAAVITGEDEQKYAADVSFVGRLYDQREYDGMFDDKSVPLKEEFVRLAEGMDCRWGPDRTIFDSMSDELVRHIAGRPENTGLWEQLQIDQRYYCESIKLGGCCNKLERAALLNHLAKQFPVVLYSDEKPKEMLHNVTVRPWVDYWQEMPKVFYLSRINLNITSRSIESGIPQRIWDIMAVGGFCLTNYQEELAEYFIEGEDLEVFRDPDELVEKTAYYLSHEDQRLRIAMNGYRKVREYHTLDHRMQKMLQYLFPAKSV